MSDNVGDLLAQRGQQWGDAIGTHVRIAQVWTGILDHKVEPVQVALMMEGLKLVRASINPDDPDSFHDAQGYEHFNQGETALPVHRVFIRPHARRRGAGSQPVRRRNTPSYLAVCRLAPAPRAWWKSSTDVPQARCHAQSGNTARSALTGRCLQAGRC